MKLIEEFINNGRYQENIILEKLQKMLKYLIICIYSKFLKFISNNVIHKNNFQDLLFKTINIITENDFIKKSKKEI